MKIITVEVLVYDDDAETAADNLGHAAGVWAISGDEVSVFVSENEDSL